MLAVSEADRDSLGAQLADRVVAIGPAAAAESYLDVDRVVAAAKVTGCDALHPGYGFLSERPELLGRVRGGGDRLRRALRGGDAPQRRQGDRAGAGAGARGARRTRAPDVVGTEAEAPRGRRGGRLPGPAEGRRPAAAGAACAGSRRPRSSPAPGRRPPARPQAAFGDGRLFLERYVRHARHVEVQVLGDGAGGAVHLGHRDCTLQRRYQKLIEEAPAAGLPPALDAEITAPPRSH